MTTLDYPRCRAWHTCALCNGAKAAGLLVCWPCFTAHDGRGGFSIEAQETIASVEDLLREAEDLDAANESVPEPDYPSRGDDVEGAECLTPGFHYARRR